MQIAKAVHSNELVSGTYITPLIDGNEKVMKFLTALSSKLHQFRIEKCTVEHPDKVNRTYKSCRYSMHLKKGKLLEPGDSKLSIYGACSVNGRYGHIGIVINLENNYITITTRTNERLDQIASMFDLTRSGAVTADRSDGGIRSLEYRLTCIKSFRNAIDLIFHMRCADFEASRIIVDRSDGTHEMFRADVDHRDFLKSFGDEDEVSAVTLCLTVDGTSADINFYGPWDEPSLCLHVYGPGKARHHIETYLDRYMDRDSYMIDRFAENGGTSTAYRIPAVTDTFEMLYLFDSLFNIEKETACSGSVIKWSVLFEDDPANKPNIYPGSQRDSNVWSDMYQRNDQIRALDLDYLQDVIVQIHISADERNVLHVHYPETDPERISSIKNVIEYDIGLYVKGYTDIHDAPGKRREGAAARKESTTHDLTHSV